MSKAEEFKQQAVYPIEKIGEFEQFLLSNKINANGYNEYRSLAVYKTTTSFCIGLNRSYGRFIKENPKTPFHDKDSVIEPICDWIFQMFLFKNKIECKKVGLYYQLLPIELKPAMEPFPAQIGLPDLEELTAKLAGFPVEFRSLTKGTSGKDDMLFFWDIPTPNSFFLKFEWRGDKRYVLLDTVPKILQTIEEKLSAVWFERYKHYNPKGEFGRYDEEDKNWFNGKLLSAYNKQQHDFDDRKAGLFWFDKALHHERNSTIYRGYQYAYSFFSLKYALTVGTRVFYLDDLMEFVDAISFSVEQEVDDWEASRNTPGPSPSELMGDAFEGDPSNLWNID